MGKREKRTEIIKFKNPQHVVVGWMDGSQYVEWKRSVDVKR
mgnify:CR=1 FL=1